MGLVENKKQIVDFAKNTNPPDDASFILQTADGTTQRTLKSGLLNDVNASLVGLQAQLDSLNLDYATVAQLVALSGDLETSIQQSWMSLVNTWTTEPSFNINISGVGDVYDYVYNTTTYYRLVPEPYDSTQDTFYSSFDGISNLTGPVATRGQGN